MDTKTAVEDVKKGRIEYRTDSYGNVHVLIGKASFDDEKLVENLKAFEKREVTRNLLTESAWRWKSHSKAVANNTF